MYKSQGLFHVNDFHRRLKILLNTDEAYDTQHETLNHTKQCDNEFMLVTSGLKYEIQQIDIEE